ncbi:hypothetical protein TUN199_06117 [Pyrenophora tritici-repentis]|uniref:Uncharacterized protein n=1 Tax=Pyrenophora tritici-repentis TaxID=45151 RepID=A0A5M9LDT5_9PLEO|nr:hypothetical protein PtrV1_04806 [Pyrenophora tritici-repentis]KAF7452507.1 hypothetical protein A1F99_042850 [Pyrenophora tritici-repentis]KAF7574360.1 hypothetical protein PtrM4_059830 [Pyrenophora tritici-repentis]KAI0575296.1 hypothetical protein Alg215_08114 [Pyrenophora tritici-repentis]KAI0582973.1 hypothetical protein Alg130_05896 [Pyrenophora tritici-repentis]
MTQAYPLSTRLISLSGLVYREQTTPSVLQNCHAITVFVG